jgi:hypothetical protein
VQNARKTHTMPLCNEKSGIVFPISRKKFNIEVMISLTAKFRMYIFGTVRMSLLCVIMMIRMILKVVPNRKRTAVTSNMYG